VTAPQPADDQRDKPTLALDDPAALAWGARLIQTALERRRRRLAASKGGEHDAA
jgi:hypothetical protein